MMLDSSAWMEYFAGGRAGKLVRDRIESSPVTYCCPLVLAEVASKLQRLGDPAWKERVDRIRSLAAVIDHTAEIGVAAGLLHAELRRERPKFGMADAFVLACARSRQVRVLTGDTDFEGLADVEILRAS